MKLGFFIMAISLVISAMASAATLQPCSTAHIGIENLVPPVAKNVQEFYNNQVQILNVDTIEPAAASAGIAIVIPSSSSEEGGAKCFALIGFASIDVNQAQATYNPANGLSVAIPTRDPNLRDGTTVPGKTIHFLINLKNSTVTLLK